MQAIKLTVFQESANYKVPISHAFRESYPLPPYSAIIGMIHSLCDFKEYHSMKISVQGSYGSMVSDLYSRYEFKNGMKFDSSRHQLSVNGFGITRGIGRVQLMTDVRLVIHIILDDSSETDYVYNCLKFPREYPSLGRREDLAVFESVDVVNLQERKLIKDFHSGEYINSDVKPRKNWSAYVPVDVFKSEDFSHRDEHGLDLDTGTYYSLRKNYSLVKPRKAGLERRWHTRDVIYTSFSVWEDSGVLADEQGDIVFAV